MGTYGGLWGPMGAYGDRLGPLGAYVDLWRPMGTYEDLSGPLVTYGGLCGPIGTHGELLGPTGTDGLRGIIFLKIHFDTNPARPFLQASYLYQTYHTSCCVHCKNNMPYQTSDIRLYTQACQPQEGFFLSIHACHHPQQGFFLSIYVCHHPQ